MSGWQWGAAQKDHDKKQICNRCGQKGHWGPQCKEEFCVHCQTIGHSIDSCPVLEELNAFVDPIKCTFCDEEGHEIADCEKKKESESLCPICGKKGHSEENCQKFAHLLCEQCGERGHLKQTCTTAFCEVCKTFGHKRWCRTLFDDYHCKRCGNRGHHERRCNAVWARGSCSTCGKEGHWAVDCLAIKEDRSKPIKVQTRAMIVKRIIEKKKLKVIQKAKRRMRMDEALRAAHQRDAREAARKRQHPNYMRDRRFRSLSKLVAQGWFRKEGDGQGQTGQTVWRMGRKVAVAPDNYGPSSADAVSRDGPANDGKQNPNDTYGPSLMAEENSNDTHDVEDPTLPNSAVLRESSSRNHKQAAKKARKGAEKMGK